MAAASSTWNRDEGLGLPIGWTEASLGGDSSKDGSTWSKIAGQLTPARPSSGAVTCLRTGWPAVELSRRDGSRDWRDLPRLEGAAEIGATALHPLDPCGRHVGVQLRHPGRRVDRRQKSAFFRCRRRLDGRRGRKARRRSCDREARTVGAGEVCLPVSCGPAGPARGCPGPTREEAWAWLRRALRAGGW
jgi:hypothetical protein